MSDIGEQTVAVLCAVYDECGFSTKCHIPIEAIARKFVVHERGFVRRAIREAIRKGYLYRKGGTKSYGLTKKGIQLVKEKCLE